MDKVRIKRWDNHHLKNEIGALSGCQYQDTIDTSFVADKLKPGDRVLEIGVGMGYVTKGLRDNGYTVSGFDIAPLALRRVRKYCEAIYNFDQLQDLPSNYFDIIICMNVAQHVPTPSLYYELFHFIRSLKKTGVMTINCIATDVMEDTGDDPNLIIKDPRIGLKGHQLDSGGIGCFCRTKEYFAKIIDRCGGSAKLMMEKPCDSWHITYSYVYHITKKYKESFYE